MRVAEPPPGPLRWAWYPGRRLGAATWPAGFELLQNCHMLVQVNPSLYLLSCHQARSCASSPWPSKGQFLQTCHMLSST